MHGLPIAFALADPKADERQVLLDLLAVEPELVAARPGLAGLADKTSDLLTVLGRLLG